MACERQRRQDGEGVGARGGAIGPMSNPIVTTYLEMTTVADLRPAREPRIPFTLACVENPTPELNRFLYIAVGAPWQWRDRLAWDRARWLQYLDRPELETWVTDARGTPAGYFELERQGDDVEIAYFGLLPAFTGLGLGGAVLIDAIRRAFEIGAARAWVHT